MKTILVLCFLLPLQEKSLFDEINEASLSKEITNNMIDRLEKLPYPTPLERAYLGTAYMVLAGHTFFPYHKYRYFRKGKKLLLSACDDAPLDLEIRYLRLASQSRSPGFLMFKNYIEEDKAFLSKRLDKITNKGMKDKVRELLK